MKKLILLLVVAGAAAGGIYYWQKQRAIAKAEAPKTPTAKVERRPIRLAVACTGRVVSNLDVEIKCKASGEVIKLPFDVSDSVKKGDLILELDPVDEERYVKQAEAALAASQAKAKQAEQSIVIAEHDLVTSTEQANTALKSAQAKAEQAKQNLLIAGQTLVTSRQRAEAALKSALVKAQDAAAKALRMKTLFEKKLASNEDYDTAVTADATAKMELSNAQAAMEELKTAELALEVKRLDMSLAEAVVENARTAIKQLEATKLALELKRQDVRLTAAQVESNRIDLALAQRRLDDTKVVAPIDAVVATRNVQIGQIISSGISNVGGGTTALVLSDLSRIFVIASVDESDIGKVKEDLPVAITVDAYPGRRFEGKVTIVPVKGQNVSNVVTYDVKIEVVSANKALLKTEMTANVEIVVAEKDTALVVPAEAVVRQKGRRIAVVVKENGATEERPVEAGINDGVSLEITSGLTEGEVVQVRKREADSAGRSNAPRGMGGPMMFGGPRR